ncbi:hypothetical protein PV328_011738 [Microctonus aethiopoides]|uniref:Uncharacterized protein n=1 Tax=Microctonus aethiopoides TaxID=144406 RepID=A0AA39C3K5_9HYME|nr:hypothetical protein PV328_011738 [Microctonus aethiopoides]
MNTELSPIELKPVNIVNVKIEDLKIASHALKRLEKTIKEESNEFVTTTITNIIRRFFCHKVKEEIDSKNLCLKVYNTNINAIPNSQIRLYTSLEDVIERNSDSEDEKNEADKLIQRPTKRGTSHMRERRSISRQPSVNMEYINNNNINNNFYDSNILNKTPRLLN